MNYTVTELEEIGIRVGTNTSVHKSVLFFNPEKIVIGHHVRIDCFSMLSAGDEGITIGRNVHVAASSLVFGGGGRVVLSDFSEISPGVKLFTATDDFTEGYLTNPTVPEKYKKIRRGPIVLEPHAMIGASSVVLPGVTLARGSTVGAMSLVLASVGEYEVTCGIPCRVIGRRDKTKLEQLERAYLEGEGQIG